MKKILISIIITCNFLMLGGMSLGVNQTYATESVTVKVTEKVPGAGCTCSENCGPGSKEPKIYECNIQTGFGAIMNIIGNMIKYATFIASLGGVLFIVINGILYSMSGMDPSMKEEAKKRITKTLLGLILLMLSGLILNAIAPWIYKF